MSKESQKIRIEDVKLLKTTKAGKKIISPAMSKMLPDDKVTRKFEDEFIVKTEQGKYGKYKINIQNLPAE